MRGCGVGHQEEGEVVPKAPSVLVYGVKESVQGAVNGVVLLQGAVDGGPGQEGATFVAGLDQSVRVEQEPICRLPRVLGAAVRRPKTERQASVHRQLMYAGPCHM
jgi:hypothetical protein